MARPSRTAGMEVHRDLLRSANLKVGTDKMDIVGSRWWLSGIDVCLVRRSGRPRLSLRMRLLEPKRLRSMEYKMTGLYPRFSRFNGVAGRRLITS